MFYRGDQGIHLAARNGHMSLVSAFVSSGCSLSSPGHHGNTVLHSAAQAAQLGVVKFCLARGVDPDCQNTRQETPLHLVAQFFARGWKSVCRFRTVICYYWSGTSLEVAEELLQSGANLNARTWCGDTAAHYAARNGTVCVLRWGGIVFIDQFLMIL